MRRSYSGVVFYFLFCLSSLCYGAGTITTTGNLNPSYNPQDPAAGLWTLSDHLYVGANTAGTLGINNGAHVSNLYGMVAHQQGGTGHVEVTGSGSLWQCTGTTSLGQAGTGHLEVGQGGQVYSTNAELGSASTGTGSATVADVSSRWDISQNLIQGGQGSADVTIRDGGRIVSGSSVLGQSQGAQGQMTVSGSDSLFAATGYGNSDLVVGQAGLGTLQITEGAVVVSGKGYIGKSATGAGQVTLSGSGSRWSNHAGSLYIGGDETAGAGEGLLDIGAGCSVDADNVVVWNTGTVQGAGTLVSRDQTTLYGTMKPGDGLGTLTVNGDLVIASGSTLEVEINNSGLSDCLTATGDVTISGGMVKAVSTETITQAHEYTVVQANAVYGQFDTLDTALLQTSIVDQSPVLAYTTDAVKLRVTARPFSDAALTQTSNQSALGTALQSIADAGGNQITTDLQQLGEDAQVREAYDQLCGQSQLGIAPVTSASTDRFQGLVSERLGQVRSAYAMRAKSKQSPVLAAAEAEGVYAGTTVYESPLLPVFAAGYGTDTLGDQPWGFWGKGYGLFGDRETKTNVVGYGYKVGGGGLGLDYRFSDTWLLGLTAGFSKGDIDYTNPSSSDFEGVTAALYSTWNCGAWYVDGLLSFSHMDYSTQRFTNVGTPQNLSGNFNGQEISGYVEVGFDWPQQQDWQIQPLAGLRLSQVSLDGYTETGGSSALTYGNQRYESCRGSLGMTMTRLLWNHFDGQTGQLQLRARLNHEFGETQSAVDASFASNPGTVFTVTDNNLPRDSAVLGAGLSVQVSEKTQLRLDYDTRFSADDQAHIVTGLVEIRW